MSQAGRGPLFTPPDCDAAREHFRHRDKTLRDKVTSVSDAVARLVHDGDYLGSGGFGGDRIATALLHEIARQRKQNLAFAGHTATHDYQILCAGNQTGRGRLLAQVDIAYIVGLEARGLSPHGRRVSESGEVEFCEWTNYTLALRLQAAAMGVPFLPLRGLAGTDTFDRSAARQVQCPYTEEPLTVVPALWPDVAVVHVHESDEFGNCRIRGTSVCDYYLARAAKRLIVSCERIVSNDEIRSDPTATVIPCYCVDAVCEVPFGSFPGNMPYEYYSDEQHLRQWLDVERDVDEHRRFLEQYLFGVENFSQYIDLCGGLARMAELRRQELHPDEEP
ncbi:MAG: CoA-transferase [Pirellulaceae bacterium]|nr:CoA-transferase [Pirellulaceae bacterium]MDP7019634.1 CoA-transferase [Pirellulaceae bacterium]